MKIYQYNDDMPYLKRAFVTLGNFDGVHQGHHKIIQNLIQHAKKKNGNAIVVTFDKHPLTVICPKDDSIEILTTLEEKIKTFKNLGVEAVIVIPFTKTLAQIEPASFLQKKLLDRLEIIEFIIGYNHAFGRARKGEKTFLKKAGEKFGFSVYVVDPVRIHNEVISSTRIRQLLHQGEIRLANQMLGRNYSIRGIVKKGKGLVGKWGIPTANLSILPGEYKLIPQNGIYAMTAYLKKRCYQAVGYIGTCPTLDGTQKEVEVHLHQFHGNLYNQEIRIEFVDFIRKERKFDSIEDMIAEIKKDKEVSIEILSQI